MEKIDQERIDEGRRAYAELCVSFAPLHLKPARENDARKEYDDLLASRRFVKIAVHEQSILAKTHMVRCVRKGVTYRIGEYMIEVAEKYFVAYNLTCQVEQFHGPHINASGTFCMSTAGREEVMMYIAEGRLDQALLLIEHALWLFDTGTAYGPAQVEKWPIEEGDGT